MKAEALLLALLALQSAVPSPSPPPSVSGPPEGAPSVSPAPAGEAPTIPEGEDRLRQVRERREALSRELERLRGEERSLLGDVERLELEVRLRGEELREIRIGLQRTQTQMDVTVRRVRDLQKSLDAARPLLSSHARALYKLGELSYLRLLLSVDRPSDFFRGYRFVTFRNARSRDGAHARSTIAPRATSTTGARSGARSTTAPAIHQRQ